MLLAKRPTPQLLRDYDGLHRVWNVDLASALPLGPGRLNLRSRVQRQDELSRFTRSPTLTPRWQSPRSSTEHRARPLRPGAVGVDNDSLAGVAGSSHTGEQALEIARMLVPLLPLDVHLDRLGGASLLLGPRSMGEMGDSQWVCRPAHEPSLRRSLAPEQLEPTAILKLHQPAPREDWRDVRFARDPTTVWPRLSFYARSASMVRRIETAEGSTEQLGNRTRSRREEQGFARPVQQSEFASCMARAISRDGSR